MLQKTVLSKNFRGMLWLEVQVCSRSWNCHCPKDLVETKGENKINFPQSKGDGKVWTNIQSLSGFHQSGEPNQCLGLIFYFPTDLTRFTSRSQGQQRESLGTQGVTVKAVPIFPRLQIQKRRPEI